MQKTMISDERASELIWKYTDGKIGEQEQEELNLWVEVNGGNKDVFEKIKKMRYHTRETREVPKIPESQKAQDLISINPPALKIAIAVAAAIVVVTIVAWLIWKYQLWMQPIDYLPFYDGN